VFFFFFLKKEKMKSGYFPIGEEEKTEVSLPKSLSLPRVSLSELTERAKKGFGNLKDTNVKDRLSPVAFKVKNFFEEVDSKVEGEIMADKKRREESWKALTEEKEHLKKEREVFEKEKALAADLNASIQDIITLNIGGKEFCTSRAILCKVKDSRLEVTFSGRHQIMKDSKDRYFFDRDPKYFRHIIAFLRGGKLPPVPSNSQEYQCMIEEFEYYGIPISLYNPEKTVENSIQT